MRKSKTLRTLVCFFAFLALGFASTRPTLAAESGATAAVKAVLDKAMDIQTREDLKGDAHSQERAKLIRKLIEDNFLSEDMARESIKDRWDKLSGGQRSEFQGLFTKLFQDSYTRMVLNFLQKESIQYGTESSKAGGTEVPTVIMRPSEEIPVDYTLAQKGGRWLIRDVVIDGVSIVDNYKNSFRKVGSIDELIKKMRIQSQAVGGGK